MVVINQRMIFANSEKTATEASNLIVGFVTDEGGINDASFNQGVYEGIGQAESELGIKRVYKESSDANDFIPNFESMLDENANMVVGAGFKMGILLSKLLNKIQMSNML